MQLTWTKEEEYVLHQLKQDLIQIKQQFINALITFSVWSGRALLNQLLSYSEFSYANIREKGLKNVLIERALRFFKLEDREERGGVLRKTFKRRKNIHIRKGQNYYSPSERSRKVHTAPKKAKRKTIVGLLLILFINVVRLLLKKVIYLLSLKWVEK